MKLSHQLLLLIVSVFRGKITDIFKSGRYHISVALSSVVTNYKLYSYTTDKYFQIICTKPSEKRTPLIACHNLSSLTGKFL